MNNKHQKFPKIYIFAGIVLLLALAVYGYFGGYVFLTKFLGTENYQPELLHYNATCDEIVFEVRDKNMANYSFYPVKVFVDSETEANAVTRVNTNKVSLKRSDYPNVFSGTGKRQIIIWARDFDHNGTAIGWAGGTSNNPNVHYVPGFVQGWDGSECGGTTTGNTTGATAGETNATSGILEEKNGTTGTPGTTSGVPGDLVPYTPAAKQYFDNLHCNAASCYSEGCMCSEGGQTATGSSVFKVLKNKIIYNHQISYACGTREGYPTTELFRDVTISPDGQTLYMTSYFDVTSMELGNDHMSIAEHKNLNYYIACRSKLFNNVRIPYCEDEDLGFTTGGDCGASRFGRAFMLGGDRVFVYATNAVSPHGKMVFQGSGDDYQLSFMATSESDSRPGGVVPKGGGGYIIAGSGRPDTIWRLEHFYGSDDGNLYAINPSYRQEGTGTNSAFYAEIVNVTNPGNLERVREFDWNSALGKYLKSKNEFGGALPGMSMADGAYGAGMHPYVFGILENGTTKLYTLSGAFEEQEIASFSTEPQLSFGHFNTANLVMIDNTVYMYSHPYDGREQTNLPGTIYRFEVGKSTGWERVMDIKLCPNGFTCADQSTGGYVFTKNHKVISGIMAGKILIHDLDTGHLDFEGVLPEGYADFGVRTAKHDIRDYAVTNVQENGKEYYYIYIIRAGQWSGGPNVVQAVKIGPDTDGTYTDDTCTPQCSGVNVCGKSDGCGGYCDMVTGSDDPMSGCENPEFFSCQPYAKDNYLAEPLSCECTIDEDDRAYCNPGEQKCEYRNLGTMPGQCSGNTTYQVYRYTCTGPSSQCSWWPRNGSVRTECELPAGCAERG
jgi:hypothetical protein